MPTTRKRLQPPKRQRRQPGRERAMRPTPEFDNPRYLGSGKLAGKVALITGGDSGIGRAVAIAFAKEGAAVAISYLDEHTDARDTEALVAALGAPCLLLPGDIGRESHCKALVARVVKRFGRLDILVNNAAEQHPRDDLTAVDAATLAETFRTNVHGMFFLTAAALPHLGRGGRIVNTASVTAYRGSKHLVDYAATKGAIVAFTRSLSQQLVGKGIHVNAVAPGPIWTPLIVSSFKPKEVATFGSQVPMQRAGQPWEVAPCYVFLASEDASYMTGQVLHPNGGEMVNG